MNKPDFTFGDLVTVDGYGARIFQVESFSVIHFYSPECEDEDLVYDLIAIDTGEWLEADEQDLTLVADAGQADEYMRANPSSPAPIYYGEGMPMYFFGDFGYGGNRKPKEPPKPTARELSAREAERKKQERKERATQIDNLLDMRRWYAASDALDAGERIAEIDGELRKVSETQE